MCVVRPAPAEAATGSGCEPRRASHVPRTAGAELQLDPSLPWGLVSIVESAPNRTRPRRGTGPSRTVKCALLLPKEGKITRTFLFALALCVCHLHHVNEG